jgi:hypothetical protein
LLFLSGYNPNHSRLFLILEFLLKEMPDIDKMNAQNKVVVICCPDIPLPDIIPRSTDIQPETGSDVVAEVIETTETTSEGSMPPTANVE